MKKILGSALFVIIIALFFGQTSFAQDFGIPSGVPTYGALNSNTAENTYHFSTTQDGEVYITLQDTTGGFDVDLYDANGRRITGNYFSTIGGTMVLNSTIQRGDYYLTIKPYGWRGITSASYQLKVTYAGSINRNPSTFEPNETVETSFPIKSGEFYSSTSESKIDQDVYQFTTNQDGEAYITLDETTGGFDIDMYDANGRRITGDYFSSIGGKITLNPKVQKGTYYIKIKTYGWNGITSAAYRLKATYPGTIERNGSTFEPNETFETALSINSGQNYNSSSYSNIDQDTYQFTTDRDGKVKLVLDNTTGGYDVDLYDENRNRVTGNYTSTVGKSIVLERELKKGKYYVKIKPYGWKGLTSAKYRLNVTYPAPANACDRYQGVSKIWWDGIELKPGQIGRLIVKQDTDLYKLNGDQEIYSRTLKAGEFYRIYAFKPGKLSVGGGYYVDRDSKVTYQTPSKEKLEAVRCIQNR